MAYNMTTDPDRARARWEAQRDLSPEEFREWEYNQSQINQGKRSPMGPPKPRVAGFSEDEMTSAIGQRLGYEDAPKPKSVPHYENGVRMGMRGPGIYTPEGGAFSSGPITKQVAGLSDFEVQPSAAQKHSKLLDSYKPEQLGNLYRRLKGLPEVEKDPIEEMERIAGFMEGRIKPNAPSLAPSGNSFVDSVARDYGVPSSKNLEGTPSTSVAFNGKGPLMPSAPREPSVAGFSNVSNLRQQLGRGLLEKRYGVKLEDPHVAARQQEEYDRSRKMWELEFEQKKRAGRSANEILNEKLDSIQQNPNLSPEERESARRTVLGLPPKKTALQEKKDQFEESEFDRKAKGLPSPQELREVDDKTTQSATTYAQGLINNGQSAEVAAANALKIINPVRRKRGLPDLKAEDLGTAAPVVDTQFPTLLQGAIASNFPTTGAMYKQALTNIVKEDPSLKTFLGRGLNNADDRFLFQRSPTNDPQYQARMKDQLVRQLMALSQGRLKMEQAAAIVDQEMTR